MSVRAFYEDSYTHEFTASIVERLTVEGRSAVVLDHTFFYPTGGGQPHDTGRIGGVQVIDVQVRKADQAVLHILSGTVESDRVACVIDWARRFDHMQQHTGQHVLSQAFEQTAEAHTVGFHLTADSLTIDLDRVEMEDRHFIAAEDLANAIVFADRAVQARMIAADSPEMVGVRMRGIPEDRATDGLRVVEIAGFDRTACGGTHVAHTGEVGLIRIIRTEKKGDRMRVEFRCGGRALRDYRDRTRITNLLVAELTCGLEDIPSAVVRLREEAKTTARALKDAQAALMGFERDALLSNTVPRADGVRVVVAAFDDRDGVGLRTLAGLLCERDQVVALLGAAGERASYVLGRSADLSLDMNALFKQLAGQVQGLRGGGQPNMAQGGGAAADKREVLSVLEAARSLLG